MSNKEILDRFAAYAEYDNEQKRFKLCSRNYSFHQAGKLIEKLLRGFDRDGSLSVLYAKFVFLGCMADTNVSVLNILKDANCLADEIEMYRLFCSEDVIRIEQAYTDSIYKVYYRIMEGKCIGRSDFSMDVVMSSINGVIQGMDKLHMDVYKKGGVPGKLTNISTKIYVFELLSEAVMAVEKSEDGIYLCFINACGSADCYFAFVCKSNGTIWSYHDRINEAYIGQHGRAGHRNHRWTEAKVDSIFPYDSIFEYSEHDYKGYATKYDIDRSKLNYCELGEDVFVPIIMAMLLISNRHDGVMPEGDLRYMSGLILPVNEVKDIHELANVSSSEIAEMNRSINLSYDMRTVMDGSYAEEFAMKDEKTKISENWYERHMWNEHEEARFCNYNQSLVDCYGKDFEPDLSGLFRQTLPALEGDKRAGGVEFVGSEKRFRIQVYFEIRKQLAEHIKQKMNAEYEVFGGETGVSEYYYNALRVNMDTLLELLFLHIDLTKVNEIAGVIKYTDCKGKEREINIRCYDDREVPTFRGLMNTVDTDEYWVRKDELNEKKANRYYKFDVNNGHDIAYLTGIPYQKLPAFIQCYNINSRYTGNSILDITDPVSDIISPLHKHESCFRFDCQLGFSKSGFKKRLSDYQKTAS